jgi:hypothetical protein
LFKNITNLNIKKLESKVDIFCKDIVKDVRDMNFNVLYHK